MSNQEINVEISKVGRTSCTCQIDAYKDFDCKKKIADSSIVMVMVDESGLPVSKKTCIDYSGQKKNENENEVSSRTAFKDSCMSYAFLKL